MPSSLKRSANLNFFLPSLPIADSFSSPPLLTLVGETVVGASSFDFLLCLPLRGISGSLTPFFFLVAASPGLSLSCLDNYFLTFLCDCKEDYLLTPVVPPCKDEVSNALLEPPDPLDETFLERTFDTTLAKRLEKVGFSPICLVYGLSPARFLVSSSCGSAPVKSLGS